MEMQDLKLFALKLFQKTILCPGFLSCRKKNGTWWKLSHTEKGGEQKWHPLGKHKDTLPVTSDPFKDNSLKEKRCQCVLELMTNVRVKRVTRAQRLGDTKCSVPL